MRLTDLKKKRTDVTSDTDPEPDDDWAETKPYLKGAAAHIMKHATACYSDRKSEATGHCLCVPLLFTLSLVGFTSCVVVLT